MSTIKKLQTLFSKKGFSPERRHEVIWEFTGGRTESSRELSKQELTELCNVLDFTFEQELDKRRKRVIASIFGVFKVMNKQPPSINYVKAIACRAAKVKHFNDIPPSRLDSIYNAFLNAQKDIDFARRIVGNIEIDLANLN